MPNLFLSSRYYISRVWASLRVPPAHPYHVSFLEVTEVATGNFSPIEHFAHREDRIRDRFLFWLWLRFDFRYRWALAVHVEDRAVLNGGVGG